MTVLGRNRYSWSESLGTGLKKSTPGILDSLDLLKSKEDLYLKSFQDNGWLVPKLSLYAVRADLQNKHLKRRWQSDAVDSSVDCLIALLYANDRLFPCKFIQSATANCLVIIFILKKNPFLSFPRFCW